MLGPSQIDLDLTYFLFSHTFLLLFSYDYFRILKLCGIEMDVHVKFVLINIPVIVILVSFTLQLVAFISMCMLP